MMSIKQKRKKTGLRKNGKVWKWVMREGLRDEQGEKKEYVDRERSEQEAIVGENWDRKGGKEKTNKT